MKIKYPEEVKVTRLAELQKLLNKQQTNFNLSHVGTTLPVLIENEWKENGKYFGRSPYMQSVVVTSDNDSVVGKIVEVDIKSASQNTLKGSITEITSQKHAAV